jgi:hypothetical protein
MPFFCSICNEESTRICVRCTKDACNNHLCEKCRRCSDCCECEVALSEYSSPAATARSVFPRPEQPEPEPVEDPEPLPDPDPDPVPPEPDPIADTNSF